MTPAMNRFSASGVIPWCLLAMSSISLTERIRCNLLLDGITVIVGLVRGRPAQPQLPDHLHISAGAGLQGLAVQAFPRASRLTLTSSIWTITSSGARREICPSGLHLPLLVLATRIKRSPRRDTNWRSPPSVEAGLDRQAVHGAAHGSAGHAHRG